MDKRDKFIGGFIVIVGMLFLLNNLGYVDIKIVKFWPLLMILTGLIFEYYGITNPSGVGLLVPAGILLITGTLFLACELINWNILGYLWPLFPFSVAVGLFQLYYFGERENGLLIPVGILTAVSIFPMAFSLIGRISKLALPIGLILLGIFVITRGRKFGR